MQGVAAKDDASPVRGHAPGDKSGRREHVGARADLKVVAADLSQQLRLLDKVVRYRFGDNAELMGAWESARNVAGSFQTKNEPESGAGGSEAPKAA